MAQSSINNVEDGLDVSTEAQDVKLIEHKAASQTPDCWQWDYQHTLLIPAFFHLLCPFLTPLLLWKDGTPFTLAAWVLYTMFCLFMAVVLGAPVLVYQRIIAKRSKQ
jgi:hypothetical protein